MKIFEIFLGLIRIPTDFLMTMLAFFLAYQIRLTNPTNLEIIPPLESFLLTSAGFSVILILIKAFNGSYSLKKQAKLSKQLGQIILSNIIWFLFIITYFFFDRSFPFSRLVYLQTFAFSILTIYFGRILIHFIQNLLYQKPKNKTKILLIGSPQLFPEIIKSLQKDPRYQIAGYLNQNNLEISEKYLGNLDKLSSVIETYQIEKVVQLQPNISENEQINLLNFCRHNQIDYSFIPTQVQMQRSNIEIDTINEIPIINLKPTPLDGWGRVLKRLFDFFGSTTLIIIFSPIMLLIAILIKLDDPKGTIIFKYLDDGSRVKRVGQKGKLFHFYKFRSMIPNSHSMRYKELLDQNSRGEKWDSNAPLIKIKNDPRVTKIGRFIRKTSLDELPQLFNVWKGEMSLVGPRPHLPEEVAKYQNHHRFVLTIKPGITGMAQTSGRSDLDFEKEVKLDTYYIENWNLWLDIKLLFKTLEIPFKKHEE